jgi:hypothetical protein
MLSIKHIEENGCESIRMVTSVSYSPPGPDAGEGFPRGRVVAFGRRETEDGRDNVSQYGGGHIYVMNDQGSTVAKYDLG